MLPLPLEPEKNLEALDQINRVTPELEKFHRVLTNEPSSRPIPQLSLKLRDKIERLAKLFENRYHYILDWYKNNVVPGVLTVQRKSRIGYPIWEIISDGSGKRDLVLTASDAINDGTIKAADITGPTILNVRTQNDPMDKVRDYSFINKDGEVYEKRIDALAREFTFLDRKFLCSRCRLVFNYSMTNLETQSDDTLMHDALLGTDLFHHVLIDLALKDNAIRLPEGWSKFGMDARHYERLMGMISRIRSRIIGGLYQEISDLNFNQPYLVPSDDWSCAFLISPTEEGRKYEQFGSGYSGVATLGKEVMLVLLAEFVHLTFGMSYDLALVATLNNKVPDMYFADYGDDFIALGKTEYINQLRSWMETSLDIEESNTFLGYVDEGSSDSIRFHLRLESAVNNFWRPERAGGSMFRPFFFLGYIMRRDAYMKQGNERVRKFINDEWNIITRFISADEILRRAREEFRRSKALPINYVLGKEYLLSKEEKIGLGLDTVLSERMMLRALARIKGIKT